MHLVSLDKEAVIMTTDLAYFNILFDGYIPISIETVTLELVNGFDDWYEIVPCNDFCVPGSKPLFLIEHRPPNMMVTDGLGEFWYAGPHHGSDYIEGKATVTPEYSAMVGELISKFFRSHNVSDESLCHTCGKDGDPGATVPLDGHCCACELGNTKEKPGNISKMASPFSDRETDLIAYLLQERYENAESLATESMGPNDVEEFLGYIANEYSLDFTPKEAKQIITKAKVLLHHA